jgi:Sec-independent protein translocase protein TatA
MEFLGVGPMELFFILIIALIVLGPKDMVKAGRTLGRWMRQIVTSPTWHSVQETSRNLRQLPTKLMRDAGLEDLPNELKEDLNEAQSIGSLLKQEIKTIGETDLKVDLSSWTTPTESTPPTSPPPQADQAETAAESGSGPANEDQVEHA